MTKLCARGKSAAKRKFKVYPSAYANAYASKICAGKIKDPSGTKRKDWGPKKAKVGMAVNAGSRSAMGRLEKSGIIKANKGVDVAPYIIKQSSQSGNTKIDDSGVGLDIYSKYGNFGISKNKNTQSSGGSSLKTKSKNITYGKNIKVGKSSNITIEGNYGKSKNKFDKRTTKGGKITFTKKFSEGGQNKIKKVIKGLKKASKLHAAQAKTLKTIKVRGGGMAMQGMNFKGVF
jgi:hypothetical protein